MKMNEYELHRYNSDYKKEVIELLSELWGSDAQINEKYWNWKYLENPFSPIHYAHVVLHKGRVVGVRGCYGMMWEVGNPKTSFFCVGDSDGFVHKSHRRKGLISQATQMMLNDLDPTKYRLVVTLSANEISAESLIKLGYLRVGFLETGYRIGDAFLKKRTFNEFLLRILHSLRFPFRWTWYRAQMLSGDRVADRRKPFYLLDSKNKSIKRKISKNISVCREPLPESMANLVEELEFDGRLRHVRNKEYLAWRFKNPRSDYRFLFWRGSALDGYLVLQSSKDNNGVVNVIDLVGNEPVVRKLLLQAAIRFGSFPVLNIWTESMSLDDRKMLVESGFTFVSPREARKRGESAPTLLIQHASSELAPIRWQLRNKNLSQLSNWDLHLLFSDGV